jgi:hypothetical protein
MSLLAWAWGPIACRLMLMGQRKLPLHISRWVLWLLCVW